MTHKLFHSDQSETAKVAKELIKRYWSRGQFQMARLVEKIDSHTPGLHYPATLHDLQQLEQRLTLKVGLFIAIAVVVLLVLQYLLY